MREFGNGHGKRVMLFAWISLGLLQLFWPVIKNGANVVMSGQASNKNSQLPMRSVRLIHPVKKNTLLILTFKS